MHEMTFIGMYYTFYALIFMISIDYNFFYKQVARGILINKLNVDNIYNVPSINKINFFFILSKIEDLDDVQIYNYLYLFKYFFGKSAFLTKIKSFFNLGKWSYSLKVILNIKSNDIYKIFFFFLNDIYYIAEKSYKYKGIFSNKLNIFYIIIKDLHIFSEKKTNLGLFFLKQSLNMHIFCKGCDDMHLFLKNLKLN